MSTLRSKTIPAPGKILHSPSYLCIPTPAHKLEPGLKARWLKDLRSGNIPQVRNTLRKRTDAGKIGYCCVGVFCNTLSHRKGWHPDSDTATFRGEYGWRHFGARDVKELAGVKGFPDAKTLSFLANLNDDGYTFLQIADWIEKYL